MTAKPAPAIQATIEDLKQRRDLAKLKLETYLAEKKTRFLESSLPYSLVDPRDIYFNGDKPLTGLFPGLQNRDKLGTVAPGGIDLDLVRQSARDLVDRNPYGAAVVRGLRSFTLGNGFKWSVKAEEGASVSEEDIKKVQLVLKNWLDEQDWFCREEDIFNRGIRDGETLYRIFATDEGIARVRAINPEDIKASADHPEDAFGIRTDPDDVETVLGYWVCGQLVPAEEIFHLKRNVDIGTRRGISDFYPAEKHLINGANLAGNAAEGESIRQAIAFVRQHAQASKEDVQRLQAEDADFTIPMPRQDGSSREVNVQQIQGGMVEDIPDGMEYKSPPVGDGESAAAILALILCGIAARWNAPSWLISALADANFASSLVAESPFVKSIEREQVIFGRFFRDIIWHVLTIAAEQGVIPDILADIDLIFDAPDVAVRDGFKEAQTSELLNKNRVLSRRTWSGRQNLDWDTEQRFIAEEGPVAAADPTAAVPSETPSAQRDQLAPRIERPAD